MFSEEQLYQAIVKIWGYYGAHADVFRMLYMQANPNLPQPEWFYPK